MGNFANTLFSVLLGWAQSAVAWLWKVIGADGADGLMGWVLDNWLALTVLLCVLGLAVDLLVYLIRWQPYRVWRSFWRRDAEDEEPEEPLAEEPAQMQWVYANGETAPDPAPIMEQPPEMAAPEAPARGVQRVIPARRRRTADGSVEYVLPPAADAQPGYHSPYYPPQWRADDHRPTDGGTQG